MNFTKAKKLIKDDFLNVKKELMKTYQIERIENSCTLEYLKQIHKISYAMCLWKVYLQENHKDEVEVRAISEIFSTYIQILHTIPLSDIKILKILERSIIENFLKLMKNRHRIEEQKIEELFERLLHLNQTREYTDAITTIKSFYKICSDFVHSTKEESCSLIDGVKKYSQKNNHKSHVAVSELHILGKYINCILILIYSDLFSEKMNRVNRQILMLSLDKKHKGLIDNLFY